MACAVAVLSPVSIHTSSPSAFSCGDRLGRGRLDGVGDGDQAGEGAVDGDVHRGLPAGGTGRGLVRERVGVDAGASISLAFPTATARPSTRAVMPWPATASKSTAGASWRPVSRAAPTMASATGCSLPTSAEATRDRSSSVSQPSCGTTAATVGRPWVMVPVLSRTTAVSRWAVSSASLLPMRMPSSAARPVPTMTAVGVARPSAQGQAMIRTATAVPMARVMWVASGPRGPSR